MLYRKINGIDKPLSALTYGTPGAAFMGAYEHAQKSYDWAWEAGFRTFDTAHSYGAGEEVLGKWLEERGYRNEAVILDKGCNPGQEGSDDVFSPETIRSQIEESLKKLRTDHVELYLLHRDDPSKPVGPIVEELNRLKKEGKVLVFGVSNWSLSRILAAKQYAAENGLEAFGAVSPAYSLVEYIHDPWGGSIALSGEQGKDYRAYLEKTGLPVFNYSSLGRGYLSGKFRTGDVIEEKLRPAPIAEYDAPVNRARLKRAEELAREKGLTVSQIGILWLLHEPMNLFPIISPSTKEHIESNAQAVDMQLTDAECRYLLGGERE